MPLPPKTKMMSEGIESLEVIHHKNLTAKTRKRVAVLEYVRKLEREILRLDGLILAFGGEGFGFSPPREETPTLRLDREETPTLRLDREETPTLRLEAPVTPPPLRKTPPRPAYYASDDTAFQKCPVSGKRMFRTANLAKKVSRNLSNRFRTYRCDHCDHFHITSQV